MFSGFVGSFQLDHLGLEIAGCAKKEKEIVCYCTCNRAIKIN